MNNYELAKRMEKAQFHISVIKLVFNGELEQEAIDEFSKLSIEELKQEAKYHKEFSPVRPWVLIYGDNTPEVLPYEEYDRLRYEEGLFDPGCYTVYSYYTRKKACSYIEEEE